MTEESRIEIAAGPAEVCQGQGKPKITICIGSSCFSRGNSKNVDVAEKFMKERGLEDEVDLEICGGLCAGKCADGPNVIVNGEIFHSVDTGVMLDLLNQLFPKEA
ncbi:MAG: (2Fe-2S) ferredoxin domain-containing protein [Thermoguttaceae bacterium]|nr:(2Fe-2S) ferredoxin domain-containing protein [Planctomycetaceae bacterium]MBQ4142985.1 (2Fe-2S) ferredoxin domain-containing protein [Thermoguttaceae bacterium]